MSGCHILADPIPPLSQMGAHMLACELRDGREPVTPNACPDWVNISDWHPWPVLAISNGELHIIAVNSIRKGALRRLIVGAATAGLSPVIVEPMGRTMPAIMAKWGWICTTLGEGWQQREEWRPS